MDLPKTAWDQQHNNQQGTNYLNNGFYSFIFVTVVVVVKNDDFGGIRFLNIFLLRILSGRISGTY